jgi:hypothetical protein
VFEDAEGYWQCDPPPPAFSCDVLRRYDADDALRFFSNVGDITVEDDEVTSWLREAKDLLQQQQKQQQQQQKQQQQQREEAAPSTWSASEGEEHLLAAMGRYGREFEAALQPDGFVRSRDLRQ